MGETNLAMCADTGDLAYAGMNRSAVFDRFADRVPHLNFKDLAGAVLDRSLIQRLSFLEAVDAGSSAPWARASWTSGPCAECSSAEDTRAWSPSNRTATHCGPRARPSLMPGAASPSCAQRALAVAEATGSRNRAHDELSGTASAVHRTITCRVSCTSAIP